MQTTIRIDEDVVKILEEVKEKENMKSYNEVIRKLLKKHELSMFGADGSLSNWKESEDRAKFR
jgi:predicted CopG family antitoxin